MLVKNACLSWQAKSWLTLNMSRNMSRPTSYSNCGSSQSTSPMNSETVYLADHCKLLGLPVAGIEWWTIILFIMALADDPVPFTVCSKS
ncbi:hypothetical protein ACFX13_030748 [Malus domestica]